MSKDEQKSKHPWRENFEGLALAIVMALTLKYFVLEAYKIPTGSMQPTLMGVDQPELQIFDRILVDKLAYLWREPERWEVVVFKYPLDQSKNYIKRLVGMPGETVRIQNGNIYTRRNGEDFEIARKPKSLQDSLWKEIFHGGPNDEGALQAEYWKEESGGWEFVGDDLICTKPGSIGYRRPILDAYADGYPRAIRGKIVRGQPSGRMHNAVSDLRFSCTALANPKTEALSMTIEGARHRYRVQISGPAGNGSTEIFADEKSLGSIPFRLEVSKASQLRFLHWDERLELEIDGIPALGADLPAFFEEQPAPPSQRPGLGRGPVSLQSMGSGVKLSGLQIDRDIYYTENGTWKVPEGRFFFLGDNTQNSYDGRLWKAILLNLLGTQENPGRQLLGDGGSNDQNRGSLDLDSGEGDFPFVDQFGERYRIDRNALGRNWTEEMYSFVPREFLVGKAILVFWPMPPFSEIPRWKVIF